MIYLDTSALLKLYVEESGAEAVRQAIVEDPQRAFSIIGVVEFASAVWRKVREDGLGSSEAIELVRDFFEDIEHFVVVPLVDPRNALMLEAFQLCQEERLRAADSIHLATALMLSRQPSITTLRFLSSDRRLVEAAARRGLESQEPI